MNSAYWALGISVTLVLAAITFAHRLGKWQGEVNTDRTNFKSFMEEIRKDVKQILTRLPPVPTAAGSPIMLTDLGERISQAVNAAEWAAAEAENLALETKGKDSLEIQEIAFDFAQNKFEPSAEMLKIMRACAFENGIDLSGVREVLGVELRDVLLGRHGVRQHTLDKAIG